MEILDCCMDNFDPRSTSGTKRHKLAWRDPVQFTEKPREMKRILEVQFLGDLFNENALAMQSPDRLIHFQSQQELIGRQGVISRKQTAEIGDVQMAFAGNLV